MALSFTYVVMRHDGTGRQVFKSKTKAEEYAHQISDSFHKVTVIRCAIPGFKEYVYYV